MKLPTLSEIGKGPLFEHKDIMGMGEGTPNDENWSMHKEEDIVSMFRRGEEGLVNKDADLKMKTLAARDKLLAGEMDAKTRLFGKQSFNMNFNMKMPRGGNMYNKNYSKKVEDIMGKSKKASKSNYDTKVSMVMGKSSKGGGFNMQGFDMKAKNYLSMSGGGMKNSAQKMNMLSASGGAPKNMNEYFGGAQKPSSKINIDALIGGAKTKGMPNMGIPGNGGINIQEMIGMAKQKTIPNMRPQGNGMHKMIMGAKDSMGTQSKINKMLGMQNITGAKNVEATAIMGMSQKPEGMAWKRVNVQEKLDLWGDADGDKVANILDCQPTNPNAQGWIHDLGSAIGGAGRRVGTAIARSPRAAYNVAKYGRTLGGFEAGEGVSTRKEQKQERVFKADVLGAQREREFLQTKYGKDVPIEKIEKLELIRQAAESERMREGRIATAKAQSEIAKVGPVGVAERAKAAVTIMEARQKMAQAQIPGVTVSGTGKKQKITYTGGQSGFGTSFGGGIGGSPMGFGYGGITGGGFGGGLTGAFGSGVGLAQMSGITHTGAGLQMAELGSTGAGFGMAQLPSGGQGMGFAHMANIQSGSGQGFHTMLGVEPPVQQMPEQIVQPTMEVQSVEAPVVEDTSTGSMMIDGVQYTRLPSGKFKNTKTGKEVRYPRGKYRD